MPVNSSQQQLKQTEKSCLLPEQLVRSKEVLAPYVLEVKAMTFQGNFEGKLFITILKCIDNLIQLTAGIVVVYQN